MNNLISSGQDSRKYAGDGPGFFYGYIVIIAACLIMIMGWGTYYAFGVFLKPVLTEFGWTRAMTSGAFSLGMIVQGLIGIVMGGLTDRLGPRVVLTICGFLIGLGYILMSQIAAVWQIYLFLGLIVGSGMSGIIVPLLSVVARWFVARRGLMTGIVVAGIGIGVFIGPPVADWLIASYDWRASYFILGIVAFIVVVLVAQFLKREPGQIGQKPYGANKESGQVINTGTGRLTFREAVSTRQFWLVFTLFICCGICLFTIMVHIVSHATDLGIPAAGAARILAAIGLVSMVGKVVMGIATDRIGSKQVFIIGFILMIISLLWLLSIKDLLVFYLFAIVFGFAYGACFTAMPPLVAWLFGVRSLGLIFGVMNTGLDFGCAVGPILAGYIFDVAGSYRLAFLLCAALGVAGLILTILIKPLSINKSELMT